MVARLNLNVVRESAAARADEIVYGACAWCPTRSQQHSKASSSMETVQETTQLNGYSSGSRIIKRVIDGSITYSENETAERCVVIFRKPNPLRLYELFFPPFRKPNDEHRDCTFT